MAYIDSYREERFGAIASDADWLKIESRAGTEYVADDIFFAEPMISYQTTFSSSVISPVDALVSEDICALGPRSRHTAFISIHRIVDEKLLLYILNILLLMAVVFISKVFAGPLFYIITTQYIYRSNRQEIIRFLKNAKR